MSRKRTHHGSRRRGTHPKPRKAKVLLTGTLHVLRPGLAEVHTAEGTFEVARRGIREGMNMDEVQVSLVPLHGRHGERVAYVQAVLQRANANIVGTYGFADPLGVVTPLDGRMAHDFFVLPEDESARRLGVQEADVVSARIVEYPTRQSAGVVTIERRLGSSTELDVNIEAVIASYGLSTEFPPSVLQEAENIDSDVDQALLGDALRRDLRDEVCLTIDPADARDYDDAVGGTRLQNGGYRVCVHIADVTHYVGWFSSMDTEARLRTCSVYLADRVLPMLPERLCNDLCSLRPHEDRLAMTVRMDLNVRGDIIEVETYPSVIRSRARLSYDVADMVLNGAVGQGELPCGEGDGHEVFSALQVLDEVARLREKIRHERGSIDFSTVEPKVLLDEEGHPVDVVVRKKTRATSLVEEAMLMANETVAKLLAERDKPTAYRVHERPSPDDLAACAPALRGLDAVRGADVEALASADPFVIQRILESVRGTEGEYLANALLLRAQKRAIYLSHNEGHYALGAPAYCHFTSPIRRYPDVLVHRALKSQLYGRVPVKQQEEIQKALPQLCRTCSERERVADAASRASTNIKMAELYAGRVGERVSGVVVGCQRFGLFVMLDGTCAEGFLPVRALGDEWFFYDEDRLCLTGESSGRVWRVGQHVAVEVTEVNVPKGRIDFSLAGSGTVAKR